MWKCMSHPYNGSLYSQQKTTWFSFIAHTSMVRGSLNWIQIFPFIQIWPPHPPCMKSSPRMDDYIFLGDRESQAKPLFATIESCVKGRSNLYIYIIYSKYINLHLRSTWKNPVTTCSVSPSEGCVHPTSLSLRIQIFPIRKGLALYFWGFATFRPSKKSKLDREMFGLGVCH